MNDGKENLLDHIDRYLASEIDEPAPTSLGARVMDAVWHESRRPDPLPFPWPRFAVGLAAGVVFCLLVAVEAPRLAARLWGG